MSAPRVRAVVIASSLFMVAVGPGAIATFIVEDHRPAGVLVAAPGGEEAYPREQRQEHVGGRCTPQDAQVAGGTIVGAGGQVVAGGGGSGVGCDTFYAYEVRTGEPKVAAPWTEPGVYLNPGAAASR